MFTLNNTPTGGKAGKQYYKNANRMRKEAEVAVRRKRLPLASSRIALFQSHEIQKSRLILAKRKKVFTKSL